ncbi:thermonuclease [Bacillus cereus]|uniref:thermonuclease family protein n=1 Tax=Bacillus cereus TaxID=1396 RepID=UPI0010BED33D|nr:thermonuclease family protein [Bacillus cereus]TKH73436.1 thermonuclease [Bacillus cereus]
MRKILISFITFSILLSGCVSDRVGALNQVDSKMKEVKEKTTSLENSILSAEKGKNNNFKDSQNREAAKVNYISDGDTISVTLLKSGKTYKVRYLCLDTPESVKKGVKVQPIAKDASKRNKELVAGKKVYLEYEEDNKVDKYGRLLAYIFVDGKMVQETLLKEGMGIIRYTNGHTRYMERLKAAETEAKNKKLGVWGIKGYVENGKYNEK